MGDRSEFALARELAAVTGKDPETERRKIARWKRGQLPGPTSRALLAAVLGGDADDYLPARPRLLPNLPEEEDQWSRLREEVVSEVAEVSAQVAELQGALSAAVRLLEQLVARVEQIEAGQQQPPDHRQGHLNNR